MVDPAGTETTLDDLESTSPSSDKVLKRNANVVVSNFVVTFGGIVVAELRVVQASKSAPKPEYERHETKDVRRGQTTHHLHRPDELDSLGVGRNDDDRLLLVLAGREVTLAHDEMHGVARVSSARDPPLVTVDDNLVAFLADGGLDVHGTFEDGEVSEGERRRERRESDGLGGSDTLLGHSEGRTSLALQERLEPLVLLSLSTVASEHLCAMRSWRVSRRVRR